MGFCILCHYLSMRRIVLELLLGFEMDLNLYSCSNILGISGEGEGDRHLVLVGLIVFRFDIPGELG